MTTTAFEATPVLDSAAVQDLAATLRGALIQPGDATYDEARAVYNATIDKHPVLIACRATECWAMGAAPVSLPGVWLPG
jgi:hypothetical protein